MNTDENAAAHNDSGENRDERSLPKWSKRLYLKIKRRDIAYLKFILEGYDHLALMTVVDKYEAVVQLSYAPGQGEEIREFVDNLSREINLEKVFQA